MLYTAGAVAAAAPAKYRVFKNVVIQPRAPRKRPVEEASFKQGKLTIFLEKAARAAEAALLPNAPRAAGDHCTFCKARANCQTFRRRVRQVAANEFDVIEDPDDIPAERLEAILAEADLLDAWISSVRSRALAMAKEGHKFSNYELGWGTRKRVWQDPDAVRAWCAGREVEGAPLPIDEYAPRGLLTPAQLEKLLKQHKLYPRKQRGQPKPDSPIAHLVGYTIPKAALKPRRVADATEDFEELEGDADE
jgi:hypothetical protein